MFPEAWVFAHLIRWMSCSPAPQRVAKGAASAVAQRAGGLAFLVEAAEQLGREVVEACLALGFARAGVCDVAPTKWGNELKAWLGAGRHGSMEYLARNVDARLDPTRLLGGARSVIMVADLYSGRGARAAETGPRRGKIARYARGRDYHVVIKKRLHALADGLRERFAGAEFRAFVDTAPVLEREYAARAGLGWIGKHTLLIDPKLGSYTLLGGVLTTLDLAATREPEADHCGTCTRCIEACPTGAISPYSVDASRCVSYLTIERRGEIAEEFYDGIGEWVYGCDVCQEVCPHNGERAAQGHRATLPQGHMGTVSHVGGAGVRDEYAARRGSFDLLEVLEWGVEERSRALSGSAMKRATLAMFKRNALIVAGNELRRRADPELESRVREVAADESEPELVRRTARAVAARIPARRG